MQLTQLRKIFSLKKSGRSFFFQSFYLPLLSEKRENSLFMRKILLFVVACSLLTSQAKEINYKKVNSRARKEYREPIRPGKPFWNGFAKKFMYAPVFDFKERADARAYLFRLSDAEGHVWEMKAKSPKADLSPVWDRIPGGTDVTLDVFPLLASGVDVSDTLGHRKFLRDFPFCGPYNTPSRPYHEAALKGLLYLHNTDAMQAWHKGLEPDMTYKKNTYACKIMGSALQCECLVARLFPQERETALKAARNIAAYLKSISRPEGAPLAYFPPTYIEGVLVNVSISESEGKDKTMTMEANTVAHGLLDLYNETQDRQYYDWALHIADTYQKIQRPDGSFPIKVVYSTGKPLNNRNAMLHPLLNYLKRLHDEYGIDKYEPMRQLAEKWMQEVAVPSFDLSGQFEDVSVMNVKPFQNLTNCTAAPYADYLCRLPNPSEQQMIDARDLLRLSEDQFVFWDMKPQADGIRQHVLPCVFEQYEYQMSVDASVCNVAGGLISYYQQTGDELALAKAIALANSITVAQDARSGFIPTIWDRTKTFHAGGQWVNCAMSSIRLLLRLEGVLQEK